MYENCAKKRKGLQLQEEREAEKRKKKHPNKANLNNKGKIPP